MKLVTEDVLLEARRMEDARFPNPKRGQTQMRASPAGRHTSYSPATASPVANGTSVTNNTDSIHVANPTNTTTTGNTSEDTAAMLVSPNPGFSHSVYAAGTNLVYPDVSMMAAPTPSWGHTESGPTVPLLSNGFAFYAESLYGEDGSLGDGESSMFFETPAVLPTF